MKKPTRILSLIALLAVGSVVCFFVVAAKNDDAEVTIRLSMPFETILNVLAETGAREVTVTVVGEQETVNWNFTFLLPDGSVLLVGVDKESGVVQRLLLCRNPDIKRGLQLGEMAHMDSIILRPPASGNRKPSGY